MIILFVQISQSPMSTTVIALVTVLACVLVSHTVMVIIVIVMCFVLKNKRDVQEHIYDSVVSAVPAPTTHALISAASTTITDDDKVKKLPRDLQKYKFN